MASAKQFLMGLDCGGGSARCALLDPSTGSSWVSSRALRSHSTAGTSGLGRDLDLAELWRVLAASTREALSRAGAAPNDVAAIACASMRHSTVLLDAAGDTLFAVPNRDSRAVGPGLRLAAEHGEALLADTGHWPYPIFTAARLRWLAEEAPEILERATDVLSLSDWMAFRLCGERASDPTQAGETLLLDLGKRAWSPTWTKRLQLPEALLPPLLESGSPLGRLRAEAAEALGLEPGIPIGVGGADSQLGLVGTGALAPGDLAVVAGTTGPVQLVLGEPVVDPEGRTWTGLHAQGGWVLESNGGPMGEAIDWFAHVLFADAAQPVGRLLAEAALGSPGSQGLLSTLGAEVMHARDRGLPVGTLTLNHMSAPVGDGAPRAQVARSLIEGVACAIRGNIEQLAGISSSAPGVLRVAGGLSRSESFVRIVAEVLGAPLQRCAPEATALGAALCGGVAAGHFPDLESAAAQALPAAAEIAPESSALEACAEVYQTWQGQRARNREADRESAARVTPWILAAQAARAATSGGLRRPRIYVSADLDPAGVAAIGSLGELEYASYRERGRMLKGDALVDELTGSEIFVTEIDIVDVDCMLRLPDLRAIVSCRGDAVNVDVEAATELGILVLNTPGRNADAVADLTLGFLLMLARKLDEATAFLREPDRPPGDLASMGRAFGTLRGRELWRKSVGLVGLGAVGRGVARRLQGFGSEVLVADPFVDAAEAARSGASLATLDELLARADFVSLHAPVTPETEGMIGAAQLARMKPGAALINTARAALVDEAALARALESGHLGAAALDVFAVEPPGSEHPLLALPRVIATPHVGGNTTDVPAHQGRIAADEIARLLSTGRPRHVLNASLLEDFDWEAARPTPSPERIAELRAEPGPAVTDLQKKKRKS